MRPCLGISVSCCLLLLLAGCLTPKRNALRSGGASQAGGHSGAFVSAPPELPVAAAPTAGSVPAPRAGPAAGTPQAASVAGLDQLEALPKTAQGFPLYPVKTDCKAPVGTFNTYLFDENKSIEGKGGRQIAGLMHFCVDEETCVFCAVKGEGLNSKLSMQRDGHTPPGVYETFPSTLVQDHWGDTSMYLAPVESTTRSVFTLPNQTSGGDPGRTELAWHERKSDLGAGNKASAANFEKGNTAGCLKTMIESAGHSPSCLQLAQKAFSLNAQRLRAEGKETAVIRSAELKKARELFRKRVSPGKQIYGLETARGRHHDDPSRIDELKDSDEDQASWAKHYDTPMHTIVSEHEGLQVDPKSGEIKVLSNGQLKSVCQ